MRFNNRDFDIVVNKLRCFFRDVKGYKEVHTQNELSILGGHYIFPTDEFRDLKAEIEKNLDDDLDRYLIKSIKENIMRYLRNFNILL